MGIVLDHVLAEQQSRPDGIAPERLPRRRHQRISKGFCRSRPVDHRPVDDDMLRGGVGPFDIGQCDAAASGRLDGVDHFRIGDRFGIALTLKGDLGAVDRAGRIGEQDQLEIDVDGLLRLGRRRRCKP